jgi:tripartite-type tricarboxylate transporter receptor subunit TctC
VPFPPGGAADAVSRIYAEEPAKVLKQPVSTSWFGQVLPAGAPQPVVDRLASELAAISRQPELRNRLAQLGLDTLNSTPAQFSAPIRADHAKWGEVIQRAGIRGD